MSHESIGNGCVLSEEEISAIEDRIQYVPSDNACWGETKHLIATIRDIQTKYSSDMQTLWWQLAKRQEQIANRDKTIAELREEVDAHRAEWGFDVAQIQIILKQNALMLSALERVAKVASHYMEAYRLANELTITNREETAKLHHEKRAAWVDMRNALAELEEMDNG